MRTDRLELKLRLIDLALGILALTLLGLPLMLALAIGRTDRHEAVGLQGRPFTRRVLRLPATPIGRGLAWLGAPSWPDLLCVVAGHMSWVGPRARPAPHLGDGAGPSVRPGIFNSWYVRSRTAVLLGDEASADADDLARRGARHHLGVVARALVVGLLPAPSHQRPQTLLVGDVTIDNLDMLEALSRIERLLDTGRGELVCFANAACVNIAARDRSYRSALRRAALVLPDGMGIKLAGDLLGTPLVQNVNGTDLFPHLLERLAQRGSSVYLLGGRVGVPQAVADHIASRWPGLRVVGARDGYFGLDEEHQVVSEIRASGADVLLVARGVPAQEQFVDRHGDALGVRVAVGVGGLFDFVSGRIPRAPLWLREFGAEWIYRLLQEPGRMWRRYLVGNASFIARVLLQRWRLRPVAAEDRAGPSAGTSTGPIAPVRAVLFATQAAQAGLPVAADFPAGLLPMGYASIIERQVERLVASGVRHLDIVVCQWPERFRELLGHGERWGATITWHLAKAPTRPYAALHTLATASAHRLLIGHVDTWIAEGPLRDLIARDRVAVQAGPGGDMQWTGWASGPVAQFVTLDARGDRVDMARRLANEALQRIWLDDDAAVLRIDGPALMRLQQVDNAPNTHPRAPESWVQMPWGARSPQAHVHPQARIEGPVLIGPGCVVEAGARVGPHTWLSEDVFVSSHSTLRDALVLRDTYIGPGLDLVDVIANGHRVLHLRHGVETVVTAGDGFLGPLRKPAGAGGQAFGRVLAAVLGMMTAPLVAAPLLLAALGRRGLPWRHEQVVAGRTDPASALRLERLRMPRPGQSSVRRGLVLWMQLFEIATGRRHWFGARARSPSQWYALHADWQSILSGLPIGLLHAPAWTDAGDVGEEAEAAADAYYAARRGCRENLDILVRSIRPRRDTDRRADPSSVKPVWRPV